LLIALKTVISYSITLKRAKMDLMGMMGKLKETQNKIEETKKRLDSVLVDEQSTDGLLKITMTANRKVKSMTIADELLEDKEQLEDYLILVMNKAIEKASKVNDAELDAVAKMDMPMIPGMENMFK
jgi:DNA-binding YbaB/EbfC family protein|tara:strand:+ start:1852 stop:2229 length:378 start_codon:yes stop_codon:yes gene_type:complete